MTFATEQEVDEFIDDWAAEDPLDALRQIPEWLSEYRLDCCAVAEPAAALLYAYDRLSPARRAWCEEQAREAGLQRFFPDRLAPERRKAIARTRGEG